MKLVTLIVFNCIIFVETTVLSFMPISPCRKIFTYYQLDVSDAWVGVVSVSPLHLLLPIKLDVFFNLEAVLFTKYVGILELNEPRYVVLHRLYQSLQMPIQYIIRFPLPSPLPTVKNISVNDNLVCVGPPVIAPVLTTIHLQHTLFPESSFDRDDIVVMPTKNSDSDTADPHVPPVSDDRDSATHFNSDDECGQPVLVNPLIAGGTSTYRGEWPWLVAVFISHPKGLHFHCSAILISNIFSVTAGHCFDHEESGILTADSVLLYLGKFNLKNWTEPNSVIRQALKIYIHPDYNRNNFSSDLALVKFQPIKFTPYIKPVCLWSGSFLLDPFIGKMGTVVGWGRSIGSTELKNEPHSVKLHIVSQEQCLRSHSDFVYLTSEKTLCAGNKDGTGPCNGDSGSGLLFRSETSLKWELRGIVSLSLLNSSIQTCNLHHYVVFTDVAKFKSWIARYLT